MLPRTLPERFRWLLFWMAAIWLAVSVVWLIGAAIAPGLRPAWWWTLYLGLTAIVSPICLAFYRIDKQSAADRQGRISERTLHLLALCGGWPGAVLGQQLFRHKTKKVSFRLMLGLVVSLHFILIGCGLYWLIFKAAHSSSISRANPSITARDHCNMSAPCRATTWHTHGA